MKKSTTEFTSSQNHSLSLAAMNCEGEETKEEKMHVTQQMHIIKTVLLTKKKKKKSIFNFK